MPERNLIQAPELLRRLSRVFGLRQMHIAPTLNEGIQATAIVADLTRIETAPQRPVSALAFPTIGAANTALYLAVRNDANSRVRCRFRRCWIQILQGATGNVEFFLVRNSVWDSAFPGALATGTRIFTDGEADYLTNLPAVTLNFNQKIAPYGGAGDPGVWIIGTSAASTPPDTLFEGEINIMPGQSLILENGTAFAAGVGQISFAMQWTEEPIGA